MYNRLTVTKWNMRSVSWRSASTRSSIQKVNCELVCCLQNNGAFIIASLCIGGGQRFTSRNDIRRRRPMPNDAIVWTHFKALTSRVLNNDTHRCGWGLWNIRYVHLEGITFSVKVCMLFTVIILKSQCGSGDNVGMRWTSMSNSHIQ